MNPPPPGKLPPPGNYPPPPCLLGN